jgi:hypothetical protein
MGIRTLDSTPSLLLQDKMSEEKLYQVAHNVELEQAGYTIVECLLKARNLEQEKQPLLSTVRTQ